MASYNTLRGFVGQAMGGPKKGVPSPATYVFASGTATARAHTFTAPKTGWYRFIMWGAGGGQEAVTNGSGAGLAVIERYLTTGQTVALSVGAGHTAGTGTSSSATFPSGEVVTAFGGNAGNAAGGSASSTRAATGDIYVVGGTSAAGAGGDAASYGSLYIGGLAGSATEPGAAPGGGFSTGGNGMGGPGIVFVCQVRQHP